MIYRQLGKTGLRVSQLGFGAMRLPMGGKWPEDWHVLDELAIPLLHAAFDAGVNYVDTAVGYCFKHGQKTVGDALRTWKGSSGGGRDKIIVSTKNPCYEVDEKEWWGHLTTSLEHLQVQSIDIYNHHGMNWKAYSDKVRPHLSKWMRRARDQKLIRHVACSFHDSAEGLDKLIDTGYPEVITLQYNMLDRKLEAGIAKAHDRGIGIVVMGPVAGGRLGVDSPVLAELVPGIKRVPELALRFVLSNPNVSLALSGMGDLNMLRENVAVACDPTALSPADRAAIDTHLSRLHKLAELYCTGCNYCKPCPQEVDIPAVFANYNLAQVFGLWGPAKSRYAEMVEKKKSADQCAQCGECEPKCPQSLHIREQLAQAHGALAAK